MGAYGSPENLPEGKHSKFVYSEPDFKMEPHVCKRCGCQYVGFFCPACGKRAKFSLKMFISSFTLGMIFGVAVFIFSFLAASGLHK